MSSIREQVLAIFAAGEPEYERAVELGANALSSLRRMVDRDDTHVAAAAVYVAGQIPHHDSLAIIARAAKRPEPRVRAAAAGALRDLAMRRDGSGDFDGAIVIIEPLLQDRDASVRKFAHRALAAFPAHATEGAATNHGRNAGS